MDTAFLLLYVDDIVLTASSAVVLERVVTHLTGEFVMKDLGGLHFFLGIRVTRMVAGFFLYQQQYTEELLNRAGMDTCRPLPMPIGTKAKLPAADGPHVDDPSAYRSIACGLQYLTIPCLELAYAIQRVCSHMHDPHECHLAMVKRDMWYVRGMASLGLHLRASTMLDVRAFTGTDWAGCLDTRRSMCGFLVYLGDALVSWSSKRQAMAMLVFCDNVSAIYHSANPVHHRRTKHVELDIHFVHERVALGQFHVLHIPNQQQLADIS
nr:uncharacterized mitochondrial protein AtMg00810-like [Aegilops tauschii subsp. strangulata]